MALAHFTNIDSHNKLWEPIYTNLFEVNFTLPTAIVTEGIENLLLENAKTVSFPSYPQIETMEQRFKYSTRRYSAAGPGSTSINGSTITFNLLKDDNHQVFIFRKLKDWYDLVWNNETGELNYKAATVGTITVNAHDKDGVIIRRVIYHNVIITQIAGWEQMDWSQNNTPAEFTLTFDADYFEDFYY